MKHRLVKIVRSCKKAVYIGHLMIAVFSSCKQRLHYANQLETKASGRQVCGIRARECMLRDTGR